jgi:hypothetical protein
MDTLLKFLGLYNTFNQIDLYIEDLSIPVGKGIKIDRYVLTLYHITKDRNMYINKNYDITYKSIFKIEEYDIDILCDTNKSVDDLIEKLGEIKYLKIADIITDNITKVYRSDLLLKFIEIKCTELTSTLFPPIPIIMFNIYNRRLLGEYELEGLSGSIVYDNDKIIGILTSNYNDNIEILPFEFIFDIIINNHKFGRRYCSIVFDNNKIIYKIQNFNKNDRVININDVRIDEENNIYYQKYNLNIPVHTYLLLYDETHVIFHIERLIKNIKKIFTINYKINVFKNNLLINFRENNKFIDMKGIIIKELSEEYIKKSIDKKIGTIDDNIYTNKKLLYVDKISNISVDIDYKNNIYILNKISGHKINNINQINKYISQNKCTLELICPDDSIIKINI